MQNQLENRVCAGFFVRLVAFIIDSLIIGLVVGIVKFPFLLVPGTKYLQANLLFQYSAIDIFCYLGVALYFVLLTYYAHTTIGKFLLGLEVITVDRDYTFINILYRETVGRFLSSLLNIGYFAILVSKHNQGFHDMLCDTYVVYKNVVPAPKKPGEVKDFYVREPMPEVAALEPVAPQVGAQEASFETELPVMEESQPILTVEEETAEIPAPEPTAPVETDSPVSPPTYH